jgi:hypothetical protein
MGLSPKSLRHHVVDMKRLGSDHLGGMVRRTLVARMLCDPMRQCQNVELFHHLPDTGCLSRYSVSAAKTVASAVDESLSAVRLRDLGPRRLQTCTRLPVSVYAGLASRVSDIFSSRPRFFYPVYDNRGWALWRPLLAGSRRWDSKHTGEGERRGRGAESGGVLYGSASCGLCAPQGSARPAVGARPGDHQKGLLSLGGVIGLCPEWHSLRLTLLPPTARAHAVATRASGGRALGDACAPVARSDPVGSPPDGSRSRAGQSGSRPPVA